MKNALIESGLFQPDPKNLQRVKYSRTTETVLVDLIPFGDVETAEHTIAWPPNGDTVKHVAGFADAVGSAVHVRMDADLIVPVMCAPVLIVLKLFAWLDRKQTNNKDADDLFTILKEYGEAGNEDRIYEEYSDVLEAEHFEAGMDAASLVSTDTRESASEDCCFQTSTCANWSIRSSRFTAESKHNMRSAANCSF